MIYDDALERNRRQGWARYFACRNQLTTTEMLAAELAVWIETLDIALPEDETSPLRQAIGQALDAVDNHGLEIIRRYVHHQLLPGGTPP